MRKLIAAILTAALVLGMSVTAFADEADEYNEYGMSYLAIDMLTHTMEENNAKYNIVDVAWNEDDYPVITYDNGFQVEYSDWSIWLVTNGDEGGKNLFKYYDSSLTTAEEVGQMLAANGFTIIYNYDGNIEDIPAGTCNVDTERRLVNINAGEEFVSWPLYWMTHLDVYRQFSEYGSTDY